MTRLLRRAVLTLVAGPSRAAGGSCCGVQVLPARGAGGVASANDCVRADILFFGEIRDTAPVPPRQPADSIVMRLRRQR
jgi:hypothetical protein